MLRLMCTKARLVILLAFFVISCNATPNYAPRNGDIIFHTSRSSQSLAIQRATHSPYSHMGIVYVEAGDPSVYEAVQPVKLTRLDDWAKRGENGHFVVKRLRDSDRLLTQSNVARMKAEGKKFQGKSYDPCFDWSDDRIYCSELVWKIYKRALGVEIGNTQRLGDFDLSDPAVMTKIQERWNGSPPKDEVVISPGAMFDSDKLVTVYSR
jgi:Permuted papain-like amidase enzyme, YaeF/YiiX, C92 family